MDFLQAIRDIANGKQTDGSFDDVQPEKVPEPTYRPPISAPTFVNPTIASPFNQPVMVQPEPDMEVIKVHAVMKTELVFSLGKSIGQIVNKMVASMAIHKGDSELINRAKAGETIDKVAFAEAIDRKNLKESILKAEKDEDIPALKKVYIMVEEQKLLKKWREGKYNLPSDWEMILAVAQAFGLGTITKNSDVISDYISRKM